jgi:hypothetical protein
MPRTWPMKQSQSDPSTLLVETTCPHCQTRQTLEVPASGLRRWYGGTFIQEAFPNLSGMQREALVTGFCQRCWDELFRDDDEELDLT